MAEQQATTGPKPKKSVALSGVTWRRSGPPARRHRRCPPCRSRVAARRPRSPPRPARRAGVPGQPPAARPGARLRSARPAGLRDRWPPPERHRTCPWCRRPAPVWPPAHPGCWRRCWSAPCWRPGRTDACPGCYGPRWCWPRPSLRCRCGGWRRCCCCCYCWPLAHRPGGARPPGSGDPTGGCRRYRRRTKRSAACRRPHWRPTASRPDRSRRYWGWHSSPR